MANNDEIAAVSNTEVNRIINYGLHTFQVYDPNRNPEDQDEDFWPRFTLYREMLKDYKGGSQRYHVNQVCREMAPKVQPKSKMTGSYRFVTINPHDGQEEAFIKAVHKFMHRKMMEGTYVFEQRGTTPDNFRGVHVHALIKYYKNLKRDLNTTFLGKFCDHAQHINIKDCSDSDLLNRQQYMAGNKKVDKMDKCHNDIAFRRAFKLENLYTC